MLAASAVAFGAQVPSFRSGTEVVLVDVFVSDDGRPVTGLTSGDFELRENGVVQRIDSVSVESVPTLITLLVDESASLDRTDIRARGDIDRATLTFSSTLRSVEGLRLLRLAADLREVRNFDELTRADPRYFGDRTLLFDGIVASLMRPAGPDRRHVVIVITDGLDTMSTLDVSLRNAVLDRTEAVLYILSVAARPWPVRFAGFGAGPNVVGRYSEPLRQMAERTGGAYVQLRPGGDLAPLMRTVLDELRSRYILRYAPAMRQPGWNALRVTVPGRKVDVRHRPGYWRPSDLK